MDSLKAPRKFVKSHLTKDVQDHCNLLIQYNGVKQLRYSSIDTVLVNTRLKIAQRSLSKQYYLSVKTNQKIVDLIKHKREPCDTNFIINCSDNKLIKLHLSNEERHQKNLVWVIVLKIKIKMVGDFQQVIWIL